MRVHSPGYSKHLSLPSSLLLDYGQQCVDLTITYMYEHVLFTTQVKLHVPGTSMLTAAHRVHVQYTHSIVYVLSHLQNQDAFLKVRHVIKIPPDCTLLLLLSAKNVVLIHPATK